MLDAVGARIIKKGQRKGTKIFSGCRFGEKIPN